jgi:hypothetical protein
MTDPEVEHNRVRLCDVGLLRNPYKGANGKIGYRCSAEPIDQYLKKGGELEQTVGKSCLCNNLLATASYAHHRKDGYVEPPIVTSGDGLTGIAKYVNPSNHSYTAQDVIDYLTG